MKPSYTWEQLQPLIAKYKRIAWVPEIAEQNTSTLGSKFSGIAALAEGEQWPVCDECNKPMQLFLQLNSNDLPESSDKPFGEGILQAFYCTNWDNECECECEAWEPHSKSTCVRLLSFDQAINPGLTESPVKDAYPEKQITCWVAKDDYPNWEELNKLDKNYWTECADALAEKGCPLEKDKLLGWPCWVQGVEYPNCRKCGKQMQLIFQIDSEDNIPYMFGDCGIAHITQCPEHNKEVAMAWACC